MLHSNNAMFYYKFFALASDFFMIYSDLCCQAAELAFIGVKSPYLSAVTLEKVCL